MAARSPVADADANRSHQGRSIASSASSTKVSGGKGGGNADAAGVKGSAGVAGVKGHTGKAVFDRCEGKTRRTSLIFEAKRLPESVKIDKNEVEIYKN